ADGVGSLRFSPVPLVVQVHAVNGEHDRGHVVGNLPTNTVHVLNHADLDGIGGRLVPIRVLHVGRAVAGCDLEVFVPVVGNAQIAVVRAQLADGVHRRVAQGP